MQTHGTFSDLEFDSLSFVERSIPISLNRGKVDEHTEYRETQGMARSRHLSIAEWVRQVLDLARRREPLGDVGKKLEVIRMAARHDYSSGDIGRILIEIESEYVVGVSLYDQRIGPCTPARSQAFPSSGRDRTALLRKDNSAPSIVPQGSVFPAGGP